MSPYRYLNPKIGNHSPTLSSVKVLCKSVHFESFFGSERVPPLTSSCASCFARFFPRHHHVPKKFSWGSMLRCLCTGTLIQKLEIIPSDFGSEKVPPLTSSCASCFSQFFPRRPHFQKSLCWGSTLRCLRTSTLIPKLEIIPPDFPSPR